MGNISFITARKKIPLAEVSKAIPEILLRRIGNCDMSGSRDGAWSVGAKLYLLPESSANQFLFQETKEIDKAKVCDMWIEIYSKSARILSFNHHGPFSSWLDVVLRNELGVKFNAKCSSESFELDFFWKPSVTEYPTFDSWQKALHS